MILLQKKNLIEEKEKISNSILSWVRSHERFLNVISLPYNSSDIFLKAIQYCVESRKNVIYITNEDSSNINILETIKKYTNFRDYTYVRNEKTNLQSKLKVSSFNNALLINEKFDLVIYDDIRSFPIHSKHEIFDLITKVSKADSKFITYSIENILKGGREISLPVKDSKNPIIEPRTILTRININRDIPFVVYEYLKWSIDCERRVVICVPDEEKIENVYFYINNYCRSLSKNIVCIPKGKVTKKVIINFEKIKRAVLITNDFEQVFSGVNDSDVMVYFANDSEFNYKKLIYFCGSVGRCEKDWKGEVIFLSNEESEDMEKAKNITRNFNKEAWEMGLLKI
ncbi:hypothetical protein JMF89_01890 [Clostridiaceae bacterium UIB06]|uniref:Competence protein ComF n=1 Tax=Clostridium thailandense TaxID=2794346 RepID=A0A949TG54_9CLOT|nr:hypothetical protein [Clostridium thailandense]MBV7272184.1 hypothetical protein [Clostridium thailandense]MCH5135963.1 hypothetical protein [Clostridiaceae bacterium UIB06]